MAIAKQVFVPDAGDIVWVDLNPTLGHEQRGRRPALVISQKSYNGKAGMMLACPMTTSEKGYPFEVVLSNPSEKSVVLADQLRCLDWRERNIQLIAHATDDEFDQVKGLLSTLLGI